jgi:hypothetical protein
MDLVQESRKILDSQGLLSKKFHDQNRSPNFIGNKAATKIVLDTDIYSSSKFVFLSESIALDLLRTYVSKNKKKIVFYDRKMDKICSIDSLNRNTKGEIALMYGKGKPFRGTVDLVCFMGLVFSDEDGVVIYDKYEFGEEMMVLKKKMMINSETKYIALSHDKLIEGINSEHFMNTDNYIKVDLVVTPSSIYSF